MVVFHKESLLSDFCHEKVFRTGLYALQSSINITSHYCFVATYT